MWTGRSLLLAAACLLAGSGFLFAETTCTITGIVIDADTHEGLPGAVITILGTELGANTDLDGRYTISKVPEGTYSLKAKMMGFEARTITNIAVKADVIHAVDFKLRPRDISWERSPIDYAAYSRIQESGTKRFPTYMALFGETGSTEKEELATLPGVVMMDDALHVRGGRADETAFFVDGCDVTDRLNGNIVQLIPVAANYEMMLSSGGFTAEDGQALSGIAHAVGKEGSGSSLKGFGKYSTDLFLGNDSRHYNKYEGSFDGPIPVVERLTFALSAEMTNTDNVRPCYMPGQSYVHDPSSDYIWADTVRYSRSVWNDTLARWKGGWSDSSNAAWQREKARRLQQGVIKGWRSSDTPSLPNSEGNTYRFAGNLRYDIPDWDVRLKLGLYTTREQYGDYTASWKYHLDGFRHYLKKSDLVYLKIRNTPNKRTLSTLSVSRFRQSYRVGVLDSIAEKNRHWWQDYKFVSDEDTNGDGIYDKYAGQEPQYGIDNPYGVPGLFVTSGLDRLCEQDQSGYTGIKYDITSQVNRWHQFQAGLEYKRNTVIKKYNSLPWDPDPFKDQYDLRPVTGSGYVQDQFETEGFIVNAGLRVDYLDARAKFLKNQFDSLDGYNNSTAKLQLSPRLGLAYPLTERFKMRCSIGRYVQQPQWRCLFDGLRADVVRRGNQIIGNPNLDMPSTVEYEAGVERQTRWFKGDVTVFYKEATGLIGAHNILNDYSGSAYYQYTNADETSVRGLEISLERPASQSPLSGSLSYTLSNAVGTASSELEEYFTNYNLMMSDPNVYYSIIDNFRTRFEHDLDWDRRHVLVAALNWDYEARSGPRVFGLQPLAGVSISIVNTVASGFPYTTLKADGTPESGINNARLPWTWDTNLRISKTINFRRTAVTIELAVTNLLNRKNTSGVYGQTGLPDKDQAPLGYAAFADSSIADSLPGTVDAAGDTIRYPNLYYSKWRDLNNDGVIDGRELYSTYIRAYTDYYSDPFNSERSPSSAAYQPPRLFKMAVSVAF